MTDSNGSPADLVIPEELKKQFPDIIELIIHSESMNTEERQYWINILPIMTPEQVQNLRDILQNERKQLDEIDRKYSKALSSEKEAELTEHTEEEMRHKREERRAQEQKNEETEQEQTDAILDKIESL